jgi:hypothetical protein
MAGVFAPFIPILKAALLRLGAEDIKLGEYARHHACAAPGTYNVSTQKAASIVIDRQLRRCLFRQRPDQLSGRPRPRSRLWPIAHLGGLRNGQRELVIGQKSGVVHALDPDQEGKILWQTRIGKGGPLGGTEWGSAADQDRIYVANSDVRFLRDGTRRLDSNEGGGLLALDLATEKIAMQVAPVACGDRSQCSPALSAAITLIPGVVFSGGVSGYLRAYATDDARLLWEIDTARDYTTVNGVLAHRGAMDGPGPIVVNGRDLCKGRKSRKNRGVSIAALPKLVRGVTFNDGIEVIAKPADRQPKTAAA